MVKEKSGALAVAAASSTTGVTAVHTTAAVESLSVSHYQSGGDGSPPRSSPGSSIGVLGRFDSGDLAMTPTALGHLLGSVTPDVLPSRQHHCNVDKWRSLGVRCGAGRPPTMENGPYCCRVLSGNALTCSMSVFGYYSRHVSCIYQ